MSWGHLNGKTRTAAGFIENPHWAIVQNKNNNYESRIAHRMYKTSQLARHKEDSVLRYVSRRDNQVNSTYSGPLLGASSSHHAARVVSEIDCIQTRHIVCEWVIHIVAALGSMAGPLRISKNIREEVLGTTANIACDEFQHGF